MGNSPGDRFADAVQYLIESRHLRNQAELVRKLGLSKGYISSVLTDRRTPSNTVITRFVELFPEINKQWLIFGDGDMLGTPEPQKQNQGSQGGIVIPAELVQMFSDMAATIRSQQEMMNRMHQQAAEPAEDKGKNVG